MERIEYDPEIDPSVREDLEAAVRERELVDRIRLEIARYAEEQNAYVNDDVNRYANTSAKETKKEEKRQRRKERYERSQKRAAERKRAVRGVLTGSILSSETLRRAWPYLLGFAVLLILYIGFTFHLQRLHLEAQRLEGQVRELEIRALGHTAERVRETRRSAVVKRLENKRIPLKEFPHPVKTIVKE